MKRTILFAILVFNIFTGQASAESGEQYWLADLGYMWKDAKDDPDAMMLFGVKYGYGFTERLALEVDYTQTFSGGEYEQDIVTDIEKGEYSLWLLGVNAAYRQVFMKSFYFKGKLGLNYGEEKRTSSVISTDKDEVLSVSGGLGVGFLAGEIVGSSLTAEAELSIYDNDLMAFTLGANVTF